MKKSHLHFQPVGTNTLREKRKAATKAERRGVSGSKSCFNHSGENAEEWLGRQVPVSLSGASELEQNPQSEPKLDMEGEDDQQRGLEDLSVRVVLCSTSAPHGGFALHLPCGLRSGVGGDYDTCGSRAGKWEGPGACSPVACLCTQLGVWIQSPPSSLWVAVASPVKWDNNISVIFEN